MLNLRDLQYFVAVANELNYSRAAMRLHVSQSALSVRVQHLERMLDVELLRRTTRRVSLTAAGEVFLDHAKEILAATDAAVAAARVAAASRRGQLRVGWMGSGAGEATPLILNAFADLHPDIDLDTKLCDYVTVLSSVCDGLTDVNFLFLPYSDLELASLHVVPLISEPRVAALPLSHRLASRDSILFDEIADDVFLDEAETVSRTWRDFWLVAERRERPVRLSKHRASNVEEFLHIVASGEGIHTTPASAARYFARPDVAFVPILDIPPAVVAVAWRREEENPLVEDFVAVAKRIAEQLPASVS